MKYDYYYERAAELNINANLEQVLYLANLIGNECYVMDDDTPIVEFDFGNKEKVMKKK